MSRTITGTYLPIVTLSSASDNPVTITAAAYLQDGLYGAASTAWQITNAGIVQGRYSTSIGLSLAGGGTVVNQSGGLIAGRPNGVYITGNGELINAGSIYGNVGAVKITGPDATVVNSGTIRNGGFISEHLSAVLLSDGGAITNSAGARIVGTVNITGAVGTLTNQGFVYGVTLAAGGQVTNLSGGTLEITNLLAPGSLDNDGRLNAFILSAGGSVTNHPGGDIYDLYAGAAPVTNSGTIHRLYNAGAAGNVVNTGIIGFANLADGGSVTNQGAGTIAGISIGGAAGTVVNDASIYGSQVLLTGGGTVTNQVGRTITGTGGSDVIQAKTAAATVVNYGLITTKYLATVGLYAGGEITNMAGATITGDLAISGGPGVIINNSALHSVALDGGGTVVNGTGASMFELIVSGTAGTAALSNSGTISIVDLVKAATLNNLSSGTLSGTTYLHTSAATLVNSGYAAGVRVEGAGSVTNQSGGMLKNVYVNGYSAGTVVNAGTIFGTPNAVAFSAGDTALVVAVPGALFGGEVNGGNPIGATAVSTLELAPGTSVGMLAGFGTQVLNFGSIEFDAGADWFISGNTSGLAGTISGFAPGDTIEVTGITATGSSYVNGVLTLIEASGSVELKLPGNFVTHDFMVTPVPVGDDITVTCFRAGTRIRTAHKDVPVETLRVGDAVLAHAGDGRPVSRPIIWIGRRSVDCRRHPKPRNVWPVRIVAGAFGRGRPGRDLFLSPDHAVFIDDVLIPVKLLINDRSITQNPLASVTYIHFELAVHAVVLAEGLPVESYLDTAERSNFANSGAPVRLVPDFSVRSWEAHGCAPLIVAGPALDAARRRLNDFATTKGAAVRSAGARAIRAG